MKCKFCNAWFPRKGKTLYCFKHRGEKDIFDKLRRIVYLECLHKIQEMTNEDNPFEIGGRLRNYYYKRIGKYPRI